MKRQIFVSLFKDRHYEPGYINASVFNDANTYNPMDIEGLTSEAFEKFMRWKADGIDGVNVYLSGLTSAALAVVNAGFKAHMYIKLYHFSYLADTWLPQPIECFDGMNGYSNELSNVEEANWQLEKERRTSLTYWEYKVFITHVKIFYDFKKTVQTKVYVWDDLREEILSSPYGHLNKDYVELMKPYLCPTLTHKPGRSSIEEEEPYNERVRRAIVNDRVNRQLKTFKGGVSRGSNIGHRYTSKSRKF